LIDDPRGRRGKRLVRLSPQKTAGQPSLHRQSFPKWDGLQPHTVFALGNIDLPVGSSISHQAREMPSIKIVTISDCPLANGMRGGV
jgi:hypothetical protein